MGFSDQFCTIVYTGGNQLKADGRNRKVGEKVDIKDGFEGAESPPSSTIVNLFKSYLEPISE